MNNDSIVFYMHAGSGNHGCEAIVNATCHMLNMPVILMSARAEEDYKYSVRELCEIIKERKITQNILVHSIQLLKKIILRDPESYMRYRYRDIYGRNGHDIYLSIGGDNYCYDSMVEELRLANEMFHKQGSKTILWGCSIEPKLLRDEKVTADLKRYDMIVARESLTYEALLAAGIDRQTNLFPDPAFCLEKEDGFLAGSFTEHNMVGVNVSPLIMESEGEKGITFANYRNLIRYIIKTTDMNVALIPHVIWRNNDDREPLLKLYEEFADTLRVVMVEDCGCMELKGYISRCRMFVGARTHATIAAYSTCVPTLVVGYSIKSKGIAKDLFGTDENYVIPVQALQRDSDLTDGFRWLYRNEEKIRRQLQAVMPGYIKSAAMAGEQLKKVIGVNRGKN